MTCLEVDLRRLQRSGHDTTSGELELSVAGLALVAEVRMDEAGWRRLAVPGRLAVELGLQRWAGARGVPRVMTDPGPPPGLYPVDPPCYRAAGRVLRLVGAADGSLAMVLETALPQPVTVGSFRPAELWDVEPGDAVTVHGVLEARPIRTT